MSGCEKLLFSGKVVIVTGSSAGIGEATAVLFAKRGAKVTIHGRRADKLAEVGAEIEKISGNKANEVVGNIEDEAVQKLLIQSTLEAFGRIDVVINNAGYGKVGGWEEIGLTEMREMLEIHVCAPYNISKLAMPELIKNKGNVVMISSIGGMRGAPDFLAYCTAKGGMDNMMRALAAEVAKHGVRLNSVNPGGTTTEITRYDDTMKFIADLAARGAPLKDACPMKRMIEAWEVAEYICFLASDAAAMISGSINPIDGAKTSSLFFE